MAAALLGKSKYPSLLIPTVKERVIGDLQKVIKIDIEANATTCHSTGRCYISSEDTQLIGLPPCIMAGSLSPHVC